jgi:hypothetical protein
MDGLRTTLARHGQDVLHLQVALNRGGGTNVIGLVRHLDVHGVFVRIGVHRDGLYAQSARCAHHSTRYLTSVGHENLFEQRCGTRQRVYMTHIALYLRFLSLCAAYWRVCTCVSTEGSVTRAEVLNLHSWGQ